MFLCLLVFGAKLLSKYVSSSGTWNIFSNRRLDVRRYDSLRHSKTSGRKVRTPVTHSVQPVQYHARLYWIHLKLSQKFTLVAHENERNEASLRVKNKAAFSGAKMDF